MTWKLSIIRESLTILYVELCFHLVLERGKLLWTVEELSRVLEYIVWWKDQYKITQECREMEFEVCACVWVRVCPWRKPWIQIDEKVLLIPFSVWWIIFILMGVISFRITQLPCTGYSTSTKWID